MDSASVYRRAVEITEQRFRRVIEGLRETQPLERDWDMLNEEYNKAVGGPDIEASYQTFIAQYGEEVFHQITARRLARARRENA